MARDAGRASGLYFKTPTHLLPDIARMLRVPPVVPAVEANPAGATYDERFGRPEIRPQVWVVDPCAADGEAVFTIGEALRARGGDVDYYTNELEASRYDALKARFKEWNDQKNAIHGDLFRLEYETRSGASVLFENPPYDAETKPRLETRFLNRTLGMLCEKGILQFLVPHKALPEVAPIIARSFTGVRCFRFPDEDFADFKQVLLCAVRGVDLLVPDAAIEATVRRWGEDPSTCEPWSAIENDIYDLPHFDRYASAFGEWKNAPLDARGLAAQAKPWMKQTRTGTLELIAGVTATARGLDLLTRRYPVAMPLKPAYVAAAVACGVFDGEALRPNDPTSGLPNVLSKGVFERNFVTIEDKVNKDGEKTGEVQVQTPKLAITVLDLRAGTYHTLTASADRTAGRNLAAMTAADFLDAYSDDLLRVMGKNCPVLYDPARDGDEPKLPELKRKLFRAQANTVRAATKLLSPRYAAERAKWDPASVGKPLNVLGLGEVGSGKSSLSLAIARALDRRSVLVICPPHLVDLSWPNEVAAVFGDGATVHTIHNIADLEAFARLRMTDKTSSGPVPMRIAVLSREASKLGHGYGALDAPSAPSDNLPPLPTVEERLRARLAAARACPKCGVILRNVLVRRGSGRSDVLDTTDPYNVTRAWCGGQVTRPRNAAAKLATRLGHILHSVLPQSEVVRQAFHTRPAQIVRFRREHGHILWDEARAQRKTAFRDIATRMTELVVEHGLEPPALISLLVALGDVPLARACAEELLGAGRDEPGRQISLLLDADARAELKAAYPGSAVYRYPGHADPWEDVERAIACLDAGTTPPWSFSSWSTAVGESGRYYDKLAVGSVDLAESALRRLIAAGRWSYTRVCGEPLYYAIPDPVRFPVANWIVKRHKRLFDFIVLDEQQEHNDQNSAQTQASSKILRLNIPSISLTGSACGGYAESLFAGSYTRDRRFREMFDRDGEGQFVKVYGYVKQIVEDRKDGAIVEFGSNSDKVTRAARTIGNAPGVLPLFLLQWLLRGAITVHKGDLALDLPAHTERRITVSLDGDLKDNFEQLSSRLRAQIKRDRYEAGKAGKLWGALMELVSYPDMAVEGIGGRGSYEVRYPPERVKGKKPDPNDQGELVCSAPLLPASTILPKEKLMLEEIERGLSAGNRFLLFARHVVLLPRLAELVKRELGEPCPVLFASKLPGMKRGDKVVGATERQAWIETEIIGKGRRVMAVNPAAVKTGLNVLTWFDRAWWHENPNCDAITDRQANGRIDRIGKKVPTEAIYPVYEGIQEQAFGLLKHKVAVSLAVDGLDAGSALAMAGIGGDGGFDAFSVGRQLFELMEKG